MTLEAQLARLLADAFTGDEIRPFLRACAPALTDALPDPGTVGLAAFAAAAAEKLCKRRLVTSAFVDAFVAERPDHAAQIRALLAPGPAVLEVPRAARGPEGPAVLDVLFLAAAPSDHARLRLDAEFRDIDGAIMSSRYRDDIRCAQHGAVRPTDLLGLLMRYCPHVVHFSGHGTQGGLLLVDDHGAAHSVSPDALRAVFAALRDNIRLVVLNACYSALQAGAIGEHIDFVIGMQHPIADTTAIEFARALYLALGYGRTVRTAFEAARASVMLANLPGDHIPVLRVRDGADADQPLYRPAAAYR